MALGATTAGGVVHGIGLAGGSVFGLGAVSGITERLFHQGIGHRYRGAHPRRCRGGHLRLAFADPAIFPTAEWGRQAAAAASTEDFPRGNSGAGAGGTAGKGPGCVRSKAGSAPPRSSCRVESVGALVVLNSLGGLIHPLTGELYATHGGRYPSPVPPAGSGAGPDKRAPNTTLGLVATNAGLTKPQVAKIADLAHDGLARGSGRRTRCATATRSSHWQPSTTQSGRRTRAKRIWTDLVGHAAADAMVLAILDAARETEGVDGWPSVAEARAAMARGG